MNNFKCVLDTLIEPIERQGHQVLTQLVLQRVVGSGHVQAIHSSARDVVLDLIHLVLA